MPVIKTSKYSFPKFEQLRDHKNFNAGKGQDISTSDLFSFIFSTKNCRL